MAFSFQGKRALVTGAGKGIGREITKALHKAQATVVAISRSQADLDSLAAECPGLETVAQDLSNWKATQEVLTKLGHFDLLVNNAGVSRLAPFLDFKEEDLDFVFDVNFKSVFSVSQVVARGMVEKGSGGSIVNVSSTAAKLALSEHAAYCPSKAAIDSLTQVMAKELGPKKGYTIIGYDFYRKREGTASHFRQPDGTYDVKYEIRDFENRMDYTVKGNASCVSRPLPDSMRMFPPCIPDNATFVGDGDLGYGSGMLGLNTWSFTVHNRTTNVDVNIRLAVTKKNCVPVAEVVQGHRNQRFFEITNFFTGYHPGLDSLKHMEIPTNCPLAPATTAGTGAPVGR